LLSFTGWWYTDPSEKYDFVSWDDDIPNMMGKSYNPAMFQTTNQFLFVCLLKGLIHTNPDFSHLHTKPDSHLYCRRLERVTLQLSNSKTRLDRWTTGIGEDMSCALVSRESTDASSEESP
jgi:hypothetical protein